MPQACRLCAGPASVIKIYRKALQAFIMKQKIGIRYCGGCNPKFDRVKFVKNWLSQNGLEAVYMDNLCEADTIYIVCGCERACTTTSDILDKKLIFITNENLDTI